MQLSSKPVVSARLVLAEVAPAFAKYEGLDVEDDKRVWVIVRQATTEDHMQRASLYAKRETKWGAAQDSGKFDGSVSEVREENYERRKMFEVYWTLADIGNLEIDGKPPFEKLPVKLLGSVAEFEKVWGTFPTELSDAIWRACVSHNVTWNPFAPA